AHVKAFVEKAKQPLGDSTFECAVNVEIEDFEVAFPKVSEHEIVPLENRTTVWGKSAFLARLVELDLFQEMKTRVDPLAGSFVSPGIFVIQSDAHPTVDRFLQSPTALRVDAPSKAPDSLMSA